MRQVDEWKENPELDETTESEGGEKIITRTPIPEWHGKWTNKGRGRTQCDAAVFNSIPFPFPSGNLLCIKSLGGQRSKKDITSLPSWTRIEIPLLACSLFVIVLVLPFNASLICLLLLSLFIYNTRHTNSYPISLSCSGRGKGRRNVRERLKLRLVYSTLRYFNPTTELCMVGSGMRGARNIAVQNNQYRRKVYRLATIYLQII